MSNSGQRGIHDFTALQKKMVQFINILGKRLTKRINPLNLISIKWHLWILLCLTPDDFARHWGTPRSERVNGDRGSI